MRVYLAIKYHADQPNRLLTEGILARLETAASETACVVRDVEVWGEVRGSAKELMSRSFALIDSNELILEPGEKGVGLGIEAGYAYAKGKRIVTIAQSRTGYFGDVTGYLRRHV